MVKLCVFSDSHGCAEHMIAAIEREEPALCFFLGDGERDLKTVQERFPALPFYAVRGNCDMRSQLSSAIVCTVGGVCIFATHGHLYNVRYEPALDTLAAAAQEAGATVALFGHTHHACLEKQERITLLNPGTVGRVSRPSYGVLSVSEGNCEADIRSVKDAAS